MLSTIIQNYVEAGFKQHKVHLVNNGHTNPAFTKTWNGTERKKDETGGTLRNRLLWNMEQRRNKQNANRRNRRNETEQNITEYGTQTEHSDCKWLE